MALKGRKRVDLTDEMQQDINVIKNNFKNLFNIVPSDRQVFNLLIESYKQNKMEVDKCKKKKNAFVFRF